MIVCKNVFIDIVHTSLVVLLRKLRKDLKLIELVCLHWFMSLIFVSLEFYLVSINVEDTKLIVFFIHDNVDGLKLIENLILVVF